LEYDKQVLISSNKIKATWEIINTESGNNINKCRTQFLIAAGKNTENQQIIVEVFNKYFTTIVKNINKEFGVNYFINNDSKSTDDFIYLMKHAVNSPNPSMNTKCTTEETKKNNYHS